MLTEAQFKDFFSPKTLEILKGKSKESRKEMLGNLNIFQSQILSQQLLNAISLAEKNFKPELESLAIQIVKEMYPVIEDLNIEIDAKIVPLGQVMSQMPSEPEEEPLEIPDTLKRRLINSITQGAALRGAFAFNLFRENLEELNPEILSDYNKVLKIAFGIYDDDEAIAMLLAMLAQQKKMEGGSSEVEIEEDENGDEKIIIKARAINFPMLVHEIIKGLYELVSLQGFGPDFNKNKQIVQSVDKLSNEPEDIRYGKFIYDAIQKLFSESEYWEDVKIREYFLGELYKLENYEFLEFIENLINDTLTKDQKWWINYTLSKISSDIKRRNLPDENDDEDGEFIYKNI